jgi:biopolymer transport protein TolQ
METQALELAHQVEFSVWALFLRATLTVKIVMMLLILASFWSWSIIFKRHIKYRGARKEAAQFDRAFWSGEPLDLLYKELGSSPKGYSASVFVAGMTEWERSQKSQHANGGNQRHALCGCDVGFVDHLYGFGPNVNGGRAR